MVPVAGKIPTNCSRPSGPVGVARATSTVWCGPAAPPAECTRIDLVTANETLWFEIRLTSAADTMTGHNGEGVIPLHS